MATTIVLKLHMRQLEGWIPELTIKPQRAKLAAERKKSFKKQSISKE